jgi:hypothetical protein
MKKILYYVIVILMLGYGIIVLSAMADAGEGPDALQNKLTDVPAGYKLVKKEAVCTLPDPCAKEKAELKKLRAENEKLKARVSLLEDDAEIKAAAPAACPEQKARVIYKDKIKEVERVVEKPVEKVVEKSVPAARGISIGGMLAYSQDGIETNDNKQDPEKDDAYTYRSVVGGPYITIPIGERFEVGAFGMFGGVNQTFGGKLGINL